MYAQLSRCSSVFYSFVPFLFIKDHVSDSYCVLASYIPQNPSGS